MSSELLDRIKPLAEKAASSFTPDFIDGPQVGGVEPPEGDRALARGRWAMARRSPAPKDNGRTGAMNPGNPTMEEIQVELGGVDGWFTMFGLHYCTMLANPRMSVLFDTRQGHTRASALDHGKRVASTFLDEWFGTRYFASLGRGFSGAFAVTTAQRDTWVGSIICGAEECGTSVAFQEKLGL